MRIGPKDLTPVEDHEGLYIKREDAFRLDNGVNGSKLRACFHLVGKAFEAGHDTVVSASSVLSPQAAMGARVALEYGMKSYTIVGGTTPEKAVANQSVRMAQEAGSTVLALSPVGYNTALQSAGRRFVAEDAGRWLLPYGITTGPTASVNAVEDFLKVGAAQVANLPDSVEDLILPFGSGNTAAGVLYGLARVHRPKGLKRIHLMTIGPDRFPWTIERLKSVGVTQDQLPELDQIHLHPHFATYGDRMPETLDGIELHPTYEGKVVRYLNLVDPEWWVRRDGSTLLWVVGGPLPKAPRKTRSK